MTCLSVIRDVCARLSLVQPAAVVSSTDKQVIQLLSLLNQAGKDLASFYPWQALVAEKTFVTVALAAQATAVAADFDRFIPNSFFNRTTRREIIGPISSRQWQALQAQPALGRVYLAFRQRTGQFLMTPTPPGGQTIAYEYVSKNWAKSNASVAQASFLADTDTAYLDEELLTLSTVWRFLRAKGFDYAEEMDTFGRQQEQGAARDGGSTALNIAPQPMDLNRVNLPDGSFGV